MEEKVGIKELYDITLRLNDPLDIDGRHYDINETILSFQRAEIAQIKQETKSVAARGGFHNQVLMYWDTDEAVDFSISHGVLSPISWSLLSNSKINQPSMRSVPFQEKVDVVDEDDFCFVELQYEPNCIDTSLGAQGNPENLSLPMGRKPYLPLKPLLPQRNKFIFCYDVDTGEKILDFTIMNNKIYFNKDYRRVMVDYTFDYDERIRELSVGDKLLKGFLRLTGKLTTKDYNTGQTKTAILDIPKVKITTSLQFQLGSSYEESIVSDFFFTGYPINGNKICDFIFLDTELTGDYI